VTKDEKPGEPESPEWCGKCGRPLRKLVAGLAVAFVCSTAFVQVQIVQSEHPGPPRYIAATSGGLSSPWADLPHNDPPGSEIETASPGVTAMGTASTFECRPDWRGNYGGGSVPAF